MVHPYPVSHSWFSQKFRNLVVICFLTQNLVYPHSHILICFSQWEKRDTSKLLIFIQKCVLVWSFPGG